MENINRLSRQYLRQSIWLSAALTVIILIVMQVWHVDELLYPMIVSALFSVAIDCADALIWRRVAKKSPDRLTTFHSSVSAFRMLLALAVMLVYFLIMGRDEMLMFFLVFVVYYLMLLIHHVWFFSRVAKQSEILKSNDIGNQDTGNQ